MEKQNDNFQIIDESKIPFIDEIKSEADIAFFIDLLETYLEDLPKNLAQLKTAVETNDGRNVQFYAHKLKGSILTLGIHSLSDLCFELETAGKENDQSKYNISEKIQRDGEILLKELAAIKDKYTRLGNARE